MSAPLDEVAKVPEHLGELSTQVADLETDLGHSDGKGHNRTCPNGNGELSEGRNDRASAPSKQTGRPINSCAPTEEIRCGTGHGTGCLPV